MTRISASVWALRQPGRPPARPLGVPCRGGPCRMTSRMSARLAPAGMKARASSCGALDQHRQLRPSPPAIVCRAPDRRSRQLAGKTVHGERARRDREARADPERTVGLGIECQRVGRCPAQEPHNAAAAQADAAVEGRRLGQARDHAPQLRPAAAWQAQLQLLDLEVVLRAGEREAQIAICGFSDMNALVWLKGRSNAIHRG